MMLNNLVSICKACSLAKARLREYEDFDDVIYLCLDLIYCLAIECKGDFDCCEEKTTE